MKELMSQSEFSKFYGVSQPMIHRYIKQGKIPAECIVQEGKYKKIRTDCAVKALEQNLDPGQRKQREESAELGYDATVEAYDKEIRFDVNDTELFGKKVGTSIDTLCFVAAHLVDEAQKRMYRDLEDIGDIFGFQLVNVEDLTGKRAIPNE